jgi:hypothetical protein
MRCPEPGRQQLDDHRSTERDLGHRNHQHYGGPPPEPRARLIRAPVKSYRERENQSQEEEGQETMGPRQER